MSACLHPCPACARHIRGAERACPFCQAALPEGFGVCSGARASRAAQGRPASRAALLFVGAAAAAGCGGSVDANTSGTDGGGRDAAQSDAKGGGDASDEDATPAQDSGLPVMYGPAPIDSGPPRDAGVDGGDDAAPDTGGGVPLYGAPPFDAGRIPPGG
jgi:hypothetical protein